MFRIRCLVAALLFSNLAHAQIDWEAPFPPHQMIGNLYFVGTEALGSYLVTTDEGHILINSDFESTVPILKANVEALGFRFDDIEIILGSHAHGDHMQGDALAKELSGAQVMATDYEATYAKVKVMPVDVFLGSHGFFYDLAGKYARLENRQPGEANPYIDAEGMQAYVLEAETRFRSMLEEQRRAGR